MEKDREEFQHDWYAILGCEVGSAREVIEKAARKLAIKYHPDKTSDPEAPAKFLLIQKAKEILLDESKKKEIDTHFAAVHQRKQYEQERSKTMDERRKRFRDDLESRVDQEKTRPNSKPAHEDVLSHELGKNSKILQEMRRKNESVIERTREEARRRQEKKDEEYLAYTRHVSEQVGGRRSAIKVKWRKRMSDGMDTDRLFELFEPYGSVEDIAISKDKANSAIIQYGQAQHARAAVDAFASAEDYRVSFAHDNSDPIASATAAKSVPSFTNSHSLNTAINEEVQRAKERAEQRDWQGLFQRPVNGNQPVDTRSLAEKEADILQRMMDAARKKKEVRELQQQQQQAETTTDGRS